MHTCNINNIKCHFKIKKASVYKLLKSLEVIEKKTFTNFVVIRTIFTFIVFPRTGFVNVTGIKSYSQFNSVVAHCCKLFSFLPEDLVSDLIIDNISAAGSYLQNVNLGKLQQIINNPYNKNPDFSTKFDRNFFPGAFCKTTGGCGTLTIFPSGKWVLVGAKCMQHVEETVAKMFAIICKL